VTRPQRCGWVLVTEAEERATLAATRGLRLAGYSVAAAATATPAVTHWSRACSARYRVADPRTSPERFVDDLARILRDRPSAALLPGGEASLLAVSRHREALLPLTRLGLPPHEAVERSLDKILLLEAAESAGLPPPRSLVCASAEDAVTAAGELGLPVLVKPARSYLARPRGLSQRRAELARDPEAIRAAVADFGTPLVLQELEVDAKIVSFAAVRAEGRLLGEVTATYARTWPPEAGAAAFAETIPVPDGLASKVDAVLATVGWEGIFELELLRTRDGLRTIDLNPRVFGWLALAIAAGANLPALWIDRLCGRRGASAAAVRAGVRYRWEDAELATALWQLRRGRPRAAAAALRPERGIVHAHFRATDPGPLVARAVYAVKRAARRKYNRA
jgi:predicted ATP-grasp superfamily ATP-dependent carboligase